MKLQKIKHFIPLLMLLLVIILISITIFKISKKQQISNDNLTKIDITLPNFDLPIIDDQSQVFGSSDLRGKYSLINIFASWCTTCIYEHEILLDIKKQNFIDLYGVAWHDLDANTVKYLEKNGNPFTKVALDKKGFFTKVIGIKAVPETLLVGPDLKIILRFQGNLQPIMIDEIKTIISN
jgi:cytochrome c biogenesis protein CcmG/thiol:disulfide interchange protein DsbE